MLQGHAMPTSLTQKIRKNNEFKPAFNETNFMAQ